MKIDEQPSKTPKMAGLNASFSQKRLRGLNESCKLKWMMRLIRQALPPSGGLLYHYLALRFSRTLWSGFKTTVAEWLESWAPASRELIIFGSSAGYSLPKSFMRRFERVICVEPDPVGRALFRRRFPFTKVEFALDTSLLEPMPENHQGSSAKLAVDRLHSFLQRYPNAAILFSNVLGQLPLEFPHVSDEIFSSHLVAIRGTLKGREWASYHDLLSTWLKPKSFAPFRLPAGPLDLAEFAQRMLEEPSGVKRARLDITDHQTHALAAGEAMECAWWELAPGRYHLIGFIQG